MNPDAGGSRTEGKRSLGRTAAWAPDWKSMYFKKCVARIAVLTTAGAALIASLAAPSHAAAAQVSVEVNAIDGVHVRYLGTDDINQIIVTTDASGTIYLEETAGSTFSAFNGCYVIPYTYLKRVRCGPRPGQQPIASIKLMLKGGPDWAKVMVSLPTLVDGGSGNDIYYGSLAPYGSNVTFDGGDGTADWVDYRHSQTGVLVDIDGNADDGRFNLDRENITGTVEWLFGSAYNDSLRGSNADNQISGEGGADALRGGGGRDVIVARGPGDDIDTPDLSCGDGFDDIYVDALDPQVSGDCEREFRDWPA